MTHTNRSSTVNNEKPLYQGTRKKYRCSIGMAFVYQCNVNEGIWTIGQCISNIQEAAITRIYPPPTVRVILHVFYRIFFSI